MADINHIISLGIGSPAGIPEFLTLGLQIGAAPSTPTGRIFIPAYDSRTLTVKEQDRIFLPDADPRTFTIPED